MTGPWNSRGTTECSVAIERGTNITNKEKIMQKQRVIFVRENWDLFPLLKSRTSVLIGRLERIRSTASTKEFMRRKYQFFDIL